MKLSTGVFFGSLLLEVACHSGVEKAAQAKRVEQVEIDRRATAIADQLAHKAVRDAEETRRSAEKQAAATLEVERQSVLSNPGKFVESGDLQMVTKGPFRHLASVSLTNNSKFLVIDPHGTLDLEGEFEKTGNSDVLASVPIKLTGSIAPGASMVFSEQQHTLAGAAIQLQTSVHHVSFTVTGVDSAAR